MSKGYTIQPWRPIAGTGQSITVPAGSSSAAASCAAFGASTRAIAVSLQPTATATWANISISQAGATAATATGDLCIKTTDPPLIVGAFQGDKLRVYGGAAATLILTELTQ